MTRRRGLCQGLQRLLDFKGSSLQALRRSSIVAHAYSLVEGPINRFCYGPPNLSRLERWQLQLDIGYRWPTYKNGLLRANQGHDWCTRSSRSDHWCGCALSRSFEVNCHGLRLAVYIKVLVFAVLFLRHQEKAIYSLPPSNRWPDWETKQYDGSVPQSICQLGAGWLGKTIANGGICLKQCQECKYWAHSFRAQLWLPPQNLFWRGC